MCLLVAKVICPWSVCMFPYDSMWSVYMSPCAYGHGVSPCLHMSPCLHVECLHVSMWIWTSRVSMSPCVSKSPCGYGHGVSPCFHVSPCLYVDMDMAYLHVSMGVSPCLHVDMVMECLHVSMCIWTWSFSMSPDFHVDMYMECLHVSMCLPFSI